MNGTINQATFAPSQDEEKIRVECIIVSQSIARKIVANLQVPFDVVNSDWFTKGRDVVNIEHASITLVVHDVKIPFLLSEKYSHI